MHSIRIQKKVSKHLSYGFNEWYTLNEIYLRLIFIILLSELNFLRWGVKIFRFVILCVLLAGIVISLFLILFADYFAKGKSKPERLPSVRKIRLWCYIYVFAAVVFAALITIF